MGDHVRVVDQRLSQAVIAIVGVPGQLDPRSPDERLSEAVGDAAAELGPRARSIVDSVYDANPPIHNAATVAEKGQLVRRWLKTNHPELSDHAISAVVNRFTFDWWISQG
jgi:hypothetical protein